uniref:Uncharacterized protein n=1 Tax=Anguilla anguilla TaxID=7936 RepID=A0A0E9V845_ANGAN
MSTLHHTYEMRRCLCRFCSTHSTEHTLHFPFCVLHILALQDLRVENIEKLS